MISSPHNPKIQLVRSLLGKRSDREAQSAFVVEGVRLTEEALAAGWEAKLVLYTDELSERGKILLPRFQAAGVQVEEVPPALLGNLSGTETSQGILAVISRRNLPLPPALDFIVIADGLRDPGNLGTLLRSAAAAGVQAVLLTPGTADAFAPKVVRSGMGAHFRLPILEQSWDEIGELCRQPGRPVRIYLSDAERGEPLWQADLRSPCALVIGAEAEGVTPQAAAHASAYLRIPMPGHSESLNAAVAAGVLLFEVIRQRSVK